MIIHPDLERFTQAAPHLEMLLVQLRLVQEIAQQGYWLSSQELCHLLGLDLDQLTPQAGQDPILEIEWRNFLCQWIDCRGSVDYWIITLHPDAQIPDSGLEEVLDFVEAQQLPATPASPTVAPSEPVHTAQFLQLDGFLSAEEVEELLDLTFRSQAQFQSTSVSTNDSEYRQSQVLYQPHFAQFSKLISLRIRQQMAEVLQAVQMEPFPISEIEAQLTSHNHGHYYKIHNDNGSPETATRELTYVYYYHRQPKAFSGGELRIYDIVIRNNEYQAADSFHLIEPRHNSIIFFPSYHLHEVLPIQCPSRLFQDGRFTINGWIRRGSPFLSAHTSHTLLTPSPDPDASWMLSLLGDL